MFYERLLLRLHSKSLKLYLYFIIIYFIVNRGNCYLDFIVNRGNCYYFLDFIVKVEVEVERDWTGLD